MKNDIKPRRTAIVDSRLRALAIMTKVYCFRCANVANVA